MTASAGQFLRVYKPDPLNSNRFINDAFGRLPVKAFHPSAVITNEKELPDVSFYQGLINWDEMKLRTDAVIIRIGQNLWPDTQFSTNWTQAKQRGILRAGYWFYDDRIDPGRQADLCASLLRGDLPEMEVWIDWENTYGGSFGGLKNVVAMMQRLELLLPGVKVGIYTGYYFWRDNSNSITNAAQYTYLKNKPLWLAWYTSNPANVLVPAPWTTLTLWQYGTPSIGHLYGVKTIEIDMNIFNGTADEFYARYDPTPEGVGMYQGKTNTDAKIWNSIGGTQIGTVKAGETVTGSAPLPSGYTFLNTPIRGYTKTQWLTDYKELVIPPPPPPPPPVGPTLTHTITVYSDGSVKVDGQPIP